MRSILALLLFGTSAVAADLDLACASWIGGDGDEVATACAYQRDGTLVVAGVFGTGAPRRGEAAAADAQAGAAVLRLSPDGHTVRSTTSVGAEAFDLAVGPDGSIHVAAGSGGYVVLAPDGAVRRRLAIGYVRRIAVGSDGTVAALVPSTPGEDSAPGAGTIHVFAPDGAQRCTFAGHRNTLDLCVDSAHGLVVTIGWRQAKASDGKERKPQPVQIAYLRGTGLDGTTRWTDYDWPTEEDAANFINASGNNMADTRGYRIALGGDGLLVAAFEAAGGNHIFRWSPTDIRTAVRVVGGDQYFSWQNTHSEHKTFVARFDPATGAYRVGQQFCSRAGARGNAVRIKNGAIAADRTGRVYVTGTAASTLPLTYDPLASGAYGGGPFVLVLSPGLDQRLLCTRLTTSGLTQAVAIRPDGMGFAIAGSAGDDLHTVTPLQAAYGGGKTDGYVAIFGADGPVAKPTP